MPNKANSLDWYSGILSVIGFGSLLYGFSYVGKSSWTNHTVILCFIIAIIVLTLFFHRQTKLSNPFLNIKLLKIKATKEQLIKLSIDIGSDVPRAVFSRPAILSQKGEVLEFLDHVAPFYILLVKPVEGLSTPDVFSAADAMQEELEHGDIKKVLK